MRRHFAILRIGIFIAALFCGQVFYDVIAVRIALVLGAARPLFHHGLAVPEDKLVPRWIPNPCITDEAGNVLFADYSSNMLVLIQGLSEKTQSQLSWVEYHLHRHSDSHKATLLAGTPNETTVWEYPHRLVLVDRDGVQVASTIEPGSAKQFVHGVMSTSGARLPRDGLIVEAARHFPSLEQKLGADRE